MRTQAGEERLLGGRDLCCVPWGGRNRGQADIGEGRSRGQADIGEGRKWFLGCSAVVGWAKESKGITLSVQDIENSLKPHGSLQPEKTQQCRFCLYFKFQCFFLRDILSLVLFCKKILH